LVNTNDEELQKIFLQIQYAQIELFFLEVLKCSA